ncbi:hypothetical protein NW755_011527 [Fusarium falciforme]|uniref:Uncharacterized protein n=1 Tax=Fusarium falciforme TaxID=195108 RepID=A0A9W8UWX7_9HYPO|nr:hypothetical protein NW755_011527 [Fusarium falciforme]
MGWIRDNGWVRFLMQSQTNCHAHRFACDEPAVGGVREEKPQLDEENETLKACN